MNRETFENMKGHFCVEGLLYRIMNCKSFEKFIFKWQAIDKHNSENVSLMKYPGRDISIPLKYKTRVGINVNFVTNE